MLFKKGNILIFLKDGLDQTHAEISQAFFQLQGVSLRALDLI